MSKLPQIEKTLLLIGNMLFPAFIFAALLFGFYISHPFLESTNQVFHISFYTLAFLGFSILLYFNKGTPVFIFLGITICYVLINFLKHKYQAEYISSTTYISLCTLAPLNLLFFYYYSPKHLLSKKNAWVLLSIFIQFAIIEQLSQHNIKIGFNFTPDSTSLNFVASILFIITLGNIFYNAIRSGSINDYCIFFTYLSIMMAFCYSSSPSGLSIFFCSAILCLISTVAQNIYNETYKDGLTGLDSRNSYMIHAKNFPLKYCIGIISIDDYDKIGNNFGKRIRNILTKLIANCIINIEKDEQIYRYSPDEFVIIYKSMDKNESFERLETIRRTIASSLFQYSPRRNPIKLTVSACIAEKKRSDTSSFEVLMRADKLLRKTKAFSHNVTSKA